MEHHSNNPKYEADRIPVGDPQCCSKSKFPDFAARRHYVRAEHAVADRQRQRQTDRAGCRKIDRQTDNAEQRQLDGCRQPEVVSGWGCDDFERRMQPKEPDRRSHLPGGNPRFTTSSGILVVKHYLLVSLPMGQDFLVSLLASCWALVLPSSWSLALVCFVVGGYEPF